MRLFTSTSQIFALICLSTLVASPALAAAVDVCLRVDQYQIPGSPASVGPFGNTAPITMWGYVQTGTGPSCAFTAPAPAATATALSIPTLRATAGDTLHIHLVNNLPQPVAPPDPDAVYTELVSVIIPGQTTIVPGVLPPTPAVTAVWFDPATGTVTGIGPNRPVLGDGTPDLLSRVRSFAPETPQSPLGEPSPVTYSFGPLRAGTYLIQSGTHPAVQVQMGLYGILEVYQTAPVAPATSGRAYEDPWSAFDSETALLFSEVDPVLHDAVASGQYGPNDAPPPGWLTSTIDYDPKYFLVNGRPYTAGSPSTRIGATNRKVLIRLLNAGLETKVPVLQGQYAAIIAEDGNFLSATGFTGTPPSLVAASCPAPRLQYSVQLPAGKTMDAIFVTPSSPVTVPVYDRRLHLTNNGASPGGMLAILTTTSPGGGATAPAPPPPCALTGGAP